MWSLTTFRVSRPTCILVGRGVTERSLRRRFEPDRERRLRPSLLGRSGDDAAGPPVLVCLFSLSLSRSTLPRRSVRSLDLGRTGLMASFGRASFAGGLGERVAVLRLVVRRSPPLLDEDDELDEDELLLEELDRDPELLRDELLSDELEVFTSANKNEPKSIYQALTFRCYRYCSSCCAFCGPSPGPAASACPSPCRIRPTRSDSSNEPCESKQPPINAANQTKT